MRSQAKALSFLRTADDFAKFIFFVFVASKKEKQKIEFVELISSEEVRTTLDFLHGLSYVIINANVLPKVTISKMPRGPNLKRLDSPEKSIEFSSRLSPKRVFITFKSKTNLN